MSTWKGLAPQSDGARRVETAAVVRMFEMVADHDRMRMRVSGGLGGPVSGLLLGLQVKHEQEAWRMGLAIPSDRLIDCHRNDVVFFKEF